MKKLCTLFLVSIYLFSATECSQLLKIPVLISHFTEHQQENQQMSFFEYLVHHYDGHERDADWETDMKLPFMKLSDILPSIAVPPSLCFEWVKKLPITTTTDRQVHFDKLLLPQSYLATIWQPPKHRCFTA